MTEEGNLELIIDRFAKFVQCKKNPKRRFSAPTYIQDLPWKLFVEPDCEKPALKIYLQCNEDDYSNWKCSAFVTLSIVSQKEGVHDNVCLNASKVDYSKKRDTRYLSCNSYADLEKGLIKDDIVVVRVHVKAEVPQGVQKPIMNEIISSISDPPDGVLIVGGKRIPIHKTYLSFYSEYFKTMFQGEFKEGSEDEITLEEVDYGEMLELLSVIYPFLAPINDKNVKIILKLADRFIMPAVIERCKKELKTSTINGAQKLLLAQQYRFTDLQMEFAQQYKTVEDAKKLKSEPEYKLLDSNTRGLVFDNITF